MNIKEEWMELFSQGPARSLQTGRSLHTYGDKPGDGIRATGGGVGIGRLSTGGDPAGSGGGENRQEPGSADGRGGDSGSFNAMEAPAFSGAAGAEKRRIHTVVEHVGAGGADGAGEPAGDQQ